MNARGIPPRRVSTPSVVLPGYRYPPGGVYPDLSTPPPGPWYPPGGVIGTPPGDHLDLDLGTTPPGGGYPDLGTPQGGTRTLVPPRGGTQTLVPPGGYPDLGTPPGGYPDLGTPPGGVPRPRSPPPPPGGVRVPPPGGVRVPPRLPHGILGNVAKHYGIWVSPPVDRQTPVKTVRRTTYAGGNNDSKKSMLLIPSPRNQINLRSHDAVKPPVLLNFIIFILTRIISITGQKCVLFLAFANILIPRLIS